ncbi:hypothetical protein OTSKATO_1257 [Orientia tsutsugamushi str. Kato PP]|uniref:Replicative DNA helicase n=1 Tax=Orientia tsutsugamushi TaxID=784 RepID=A0A2U3QUT5_ORITS|nr:hypothetical protein OTSKATO_1257 [Orientia tsutsugamushi str. Kato PP]SPR02479.1 replicative DNA helicase [Orientia tsutsugamushi]SPR04706.1 replicative DNA helicase [Orientia tsutsugamushi]
MGKTALGVNLAINACKYFLTQNLKLIALHYFTVK